MFCGRMKPGGAAADKSGVRPETDSLSGAWAEGQTVFYQFGCNPAQSVGQAVVGIVKNRRITNLYTIVIA